MSSYPFPIFSVAPMMNCTDKHFRYFLRLISPDARLYTEMITMEALFYGNKNKLLEFDPAEKYLALQLGGNDPKKLAQCAQWGEAFGYDEINLNVGCPSERVSSGNFGACLMLRPRLVADCIFAMQNAVQITVTVKCRIGVDHQDSFDELVHFVECVAEAGCKIFIFHARKAWLAGLSPKENRIKPPLNYEIVRQIKKKFPELTIILNGGLNSWYDIEKEFFGVDGLMIGRAAYTNPFLFAEIQKKFFPEKKILNRYEVVKNFIPYLVDQMKRGVRLASMTRHILGLFHGEKGARIWRRTLSENAWKKNAGVEVIEEAIGVSVT